MSDDITIAQAAAQLNVFRSTIVRWIHTGSFPGAYKLNPDATNSPYRIPQRDIDAYLVRRHRHAVKK